MDNIPSDTTRIENAIDRLIAEIKAFREAWEKSPQHEINTLMLGNIKAQMGGGIVPAGGILKPGNH